MSDILWKTLSACLTVVRSVDRLPSGSCSVVCLAHTASGSVVFGTFKLTFSLDVPQ